MMPSRAILSIIAATMAVLLGPSRAADAGSEVYIQQARGQVAPGSTVMTKPTPETTAQPSQPAASSSTTAPDTCNAQNAASSQACYAATQQARPASR
jgi:hypothetical protein